MAKQNRRQETPKRYFSMVQQGRVATFNIYGDITSWPWLESDVSAYSMVTALDELKDVDEIHVYINSYGGECAEGLAIYSALRRRAASAKIYTYADGFACSIASVIFMAGDVRVMTRASLLMIHNASTSVWGGNAQDMRKTADELDTITERSVEIYAHASNLEADTLRELMDAETWIPAEQALEWGLCTEIGDEVAENPTQSVRASVVAALMNAAQRAPGANQNPSEGKQSAPKAEQNPPDDGKTPPPDDPEEPESTPEETAQKIWSGFFHALTND